MPIYTRETLHTDKLPWVEIDDFEFFVLGRLPVARPNSTQSNGHTPYWGADPDPVARTIQPTHPRERLVVLHGTVVVESEHGRITLNRRDFVEIPQSGAKVQNIGNATAELGHVKGHWTQVIRQEICLFRPDRPCDYHYHDGDEYWMVFRGHFTLNYDERAYAMRPGLMLAAGMGFEHGSTAPEEHFEAIVMAMGLGGQKRDGHLLREMHGAPVKQREVPEAAMRAHQLQPGMSTTAIPWTDVGRTSIRTTRLGIGTWGFGPIGAPETQVGDDEALVAVLRAAFEAGIRYLDTAESYANEERLGRLLPEAGAPSDLTIVTKSGRSGKIREGFTADHFRRSAENSLRDLKLEKLPLLLIHDPRGEDDMAEVMGPGGALEGLRKLQSEGLVEAIGVATGTIGPLWQAVESGEFDVIQMPRLYTLLNTAGKDTGLLAAAKAKGMGTMVPAPFGGNILATGVTERPVYMYRPAIPEVVEAVRRMQERCAELGISLPVAALAFALSEPLVDVTIVGLARPQEVHWNMPAFDPGVTREQLESIREAGRIDPVLIGGPDFKPVPAAAPR